MQPVQDAGARVFSHQADVPATECQAPLSWDAVETLLLHTCKVPVGPWHDFQPPCRTVDAFQGGTGHPEQQIFLLSRDDLELLLKNAFLWVFQGP